MLFISSAIHRPVEYIKIEHIGASDKPIPTVIISRNPIKLPKDDYSIIYFDVIEESDYNMIMTYVNHTKSDRFKVAEFGTFEISIISSSKIISIHHFDKKSSIRLFTKIVEMLKKESKNEDLTSHLEELKKRLGS